MAENWMIYGAAGYTGRMIAKEAVAQGLRPVLAGRGESVSALANELGLSHRLFPLDDADRVRQGLAGIDLVLLTAGPFSATSAAMVQGCLEQGCHYLDITGEIEVFEAVHARGEEAGKKGVTLCPGVGFDVIPTDCIAATLGEAMPDAHLLRLGFDSRSGPSPGTAKTAVEGLAGGGRARLDGQIRQVPLGWKTDRIDFGDGPKLAVTIPWGDVATAYYTTGIPNIEVYMPLSPKSVKWVRRANWVRPLLGLGPVQSLMKKQAGKVRGPDDETRRRTPTHVWGDVRNEAGDVRTARVVTANGYDVTVSGSLTVVRHLLENPAAGATTPARLLGADLITRLPGSGEILLD